MSTPGHIKESLIVAFQNAEAMAPVVPILKSSLEKHLLSGNTDFHKFGLIAYNGTQVRSVIPFEPINAELMKQITRLEIKYSRPKQERTKNLVSVLQHLKTVIGTSSSDFHSIVLITSQKTPYLQSNIKTEAVVKTLLSDITDLRATIYPILVNPDSVSGGGGDFDFDFDTWKSLRYTPLSMIPSQQELVLPLNLEVANLDTISRRLDAVFSSPNVYTFTRAKLEIGNMKLAVLSFKMIVKKSITPSKLYFGVDPPEQPTTTSSFVLTKSGKEVQNVSKQMIVTKGTTYSLSMNAVDTELNNEVVFKIIKFQNNTNSNEFTKLISDSSSFFITADDSSILNSSKALHKLVKQMKQMGVVASAVVYTKTSPILGTLYPDFKNSITDNNNDNLVFVPTPAEDYIRPKPEGFCDVTVRQNTKSKMDKLVTGFYLGHEFNPSRFEDPRFAQKSMVLKHYALGTEMPTQQQMLNGKMTDVPIEVVDKTRPRYGKIAEYLGPLVSEVANEFKIPVFITPKKRDFHELSSQTNYLENTAEGKNAKMQYRNSISLTQLGTQPVGSQVQLSQSQDEEILHAIDLMNSGNLRKLTVKQIHSALQKLLHRTVPGRKDELIEVLQTTLLNLSK